MQNVVGGAGVIVSQSSPVYVTQTGVVRWNGVLQRLEIMGNGNEWILCPEASMTTIDIKSEILDAVLWVQKKQLEEKVLIDLCEKHPGLNDLKEKFEIMAALVKEHEKNGNI